MSENFFETPILNSPYGYPGRHWELDDSGQPTNHIITSRRQAEFITPIPKPKKRKGAAGQQEIVVDEGKGLSGQDQQFDPKPIINQLRQEVDTWRKLDRSLWQVTPETAQLLHHWRNHDFSSYRPFFCQLEAVETAIWLTEVAPNRGKGFVEYLRGANDMSNPGLSRLALKLATGAGKTTVMAMLITWQTINAARHPNSKNFTRGFLVVAPGITIRDRLRVLLPNDPDSYYRSRELVPEGMYEELQKAKIVITNFHAFKLRETLDVAKGTRSLLQGRGEELSTLETEGQMLQRVMPELMGMKNIMVLNDEAHHCYQQKPEGKSEEPDLKGDDRKEAEKNTEYARIWINGLKMVDKKLGVRRVIDLSATPFFLKGSGYPEGVLFPWTMSDFSLMDAIECGIVKLPRVPIADNIPGEEMPMYRNLWDHIKTKMPKKGRGKAAGLNPLALPAPLTNALDALYGHYEKTYKEWEKAGTKVPPCFIVVCNNTATSKLVYDYISGFESENADGSTNFNAGRLELFRNFDEDGNQLGRPRTLLIDSEQLESGDALDKKFRDMASDEIERFRREIIERTGDKQQAEKISDQDLLREVMNTVGKEGRLGESVRCVVSVSMLTEGWDANTVTHILGVRAFGTQLLCEQVVGRGLRRLSYDLNEDNKFDVEYADILGIPFDFTAKPQPGKIKPPKPTIQVKAITPDRDECEITFPRVAGYRVELPKERLEADFNDDSILTLTPDLIGATKTQNSGIIGERAELNLEHTADKRPSAIIYDLARHLVVEHWRDEGGNVQPGLFMDLKRITREWLKDCLVCKGGTFPAQVQYRAIADMACERITSAIVRRNLGEKAIRVLRDPYNPSGSTRLVNFNSSKRERWETDPHKCHINYALFDSDWEAEFCRVVENHPNVIRYVKNHNLGLHVPYEMAGEQHRYIPDFIVVIDDGKGKEDPLHLIVEIKGYRGEDAKQKADTIKTYWIPGVNYLGSFGRWAFAEFCDVYEIESDFKDKVEGRLKKMIEETIAVQPTEVG